MRPNDPISISVLQRSSAAHLVSSAFIHRVSHPDRFWKRGQVCGPPLGFLRFSPFFLELLGQPGEGGGGGSRNSKLGTRNFPWDFSFFRPFLWDLWENRGEGVGASGDSELSTRNSELSTQHSALVYQLANYNVQLAAVFPQVTWA